MPRWLAVSTLLLSCSDDAGPTTPSQDACAPECPPGADASPDLQSCLDEDGDTYGADCLPGPDCDDRDAQVSPDAVEVCNAVDDNCDGVTDEGCPWAVSAGGPLSWQDQGLAIVALADGGALVTGFFGGEATFNSGKEGHTTLALDGVGTFLARYDLTGRLIWVRGIDNAEGLAVAALPDGGGIVAGRFGGTGATFAEGEAGETTLPLAGVLDAFVARYDSSGSLVWAKRAGGTEYDQATGVAALPDGSVLVTGMFYGSGTFGPGEAGETTLSSAGSGDIFIARLDPAGDLDWVRQAGGANVDAGFAISAFADGGAVATGMFRETATFGPGEAGEAVVTADIGMDVFVAKYSPSGDLGWVRIAGGIWQNDRGKGIGATPDGGAVVTGPIAGTVTFSPGAPDETMVETQSADIFLARYGAAGELLWVTLAGGTDWDEGNAVSILADGSSLVAGGFIRNAVFGEGEPTETTLASPSNGGDLFVARYDAQGDFMGVRQAGAAMGIGSPLAWGNGIAALPDGSALVTGAYTLEVRFFEGQAFETFLGGKDDFGSEIFVARFPP